MLDIRGKGIRRYQIDQPFPALGESSTLPKTLTILESPESLEDLRAARELLRGGGIVLLPTETVYGVAGLLTSPIARSRLRTLKGSHGVEEGGVPPPLTPHVGSLDQAKLYLGEVSEFALRVMKKLWPGPVGLVFDVASEQRAKVAGELGVEEGELYREGRITLRCPDHVLTRKLLSESGPVVITQAPAVGGGAALKVNEVTEAALLGVDLVIDGGATRFSRPSTLLHVKKNDYNVIRPGVYDRRIIDRMLTTTILFVCSGNTCRSPMAMALARKVLAGKLGTTPERLEEKGIAVLSAGSFATPGSRATSQAVEAVAGMNADLSTHRSRPLTVELIQSADRIYTMGRSHRAAVLSLVPSAAEKTVLLDPSGMDIEDPIGSNVSVYKSLAADLEKLIIRRFEEKPVV